VATDLQMVAFVASAPQIMVVRSGLPVDSVPALIALAKANPGKLSFASAGVGTTVHLAGELLKYAAGIDVLHVPFKGGGQAISSLVTGEVDILFNNPGAVLVYIKSGKLKALAVAGPQRLKSMPQLPTVAEAGVRGYSYDTWYGIFAPAAAGSALVDWLNAAINRALADPAVHERLVESGLDPAASSPAAFQKLFRDDVTRWTRAIREAGIKAE